MSKNASTGLVGLTALFVSQIMWYIRIFDEVIDPAIGVLIDKTDTKFGKYRPILVLGNIITIISFLILFNIHTMGGGMNIPICLLALVVHKIGYSLQATVTKAGQAALTNDPKQRPIFNIVDGWVTTLLFTGGQIVVANFLAPKYGGFTPEFFKVFIPGVMIISAILGILAVIGIAQKDNKQYFGIGEKTTKTSFKDYWEIVKGNRPLQMLTMAADISDYETSVSGRYVSGMLSTMFSLTDSVASSFAPMSIGWILAAVGFAQAYPTADTPLSPQLRMAGIVLISVLPLVGTLVALAFMKFYPLNKEAMEEVQAKISAMKQVDTVEEAEEIAQKSL